MKIGIKVGDVMTRNFTSANPESGISECIKAMNKKRVGSLVVKKSSELAGILTEGDIINAIAKKKDINSLKAGEIMTRKVKTITPEKDMYEALVAMKKNKIRWLPVVSESKKVIGLLTMKDILRIEPSLFDTFIESQEIKEEAAKLKASESRAWVKEGNCSECEAHGLLYNINNRMVCEDCREEIEEE